MTIENEESVYSGKLPTDGQQQFVDR